MGRLKQINWKEHKVLKSLLWSYFIIVVLYLVFCSAVQIRSMSIIEAQSRSIYTNMLEVLAEIIDKQTETVEAAAIDTALNTNVKTLVSRNQAGRTHDGYIVKLVREKLAMAQWTKQEIESIYLYFGKWDYVISDKTAAGAGLYYSTYFTNPVMEYEEWVGWMNSASTGYYSFGYQDGTEKLFYLLRLPIGAKAGINGAVLAVEMADSSIAGSVADFTADNQIYIDVISEDGTYIVNSDAGDGSDYQVVEVISENSGWRYQGFIPTALYKKQVNSLLWLMFGGLAIVTALCAFTVIVSIRKNYLPLKELTDRLGVELNKESKSEGEYVYIWESFTELVDKQRQDKKRINTQLAQMKEMYVEQLLKGNIQWEEEVTDNLEAFHLNFVDQEFADIKIRITGQDGSFEKELAENVFRSDGIYTADGRIFRGGYSRKKNRTWHYLADMSDTSAEEQKLKLGEIIRYLGENGLETKAAVSAVHYGREETKTAYEEACRVFKQFESEKYGEIPVLVYDEIFDGRKPEDKAGRDGDSAGEREPTREEQLKREVLDYIAVHYAKEDLNVEKICRDFNRSVSAMGKAFKESGGEGILYYINERRILEAKKIILNRNGDVNLGQVSEEVGYTNSNTFIRVFKKYEGMTPGKYCMLVRK